MRFIAAALLCLGIVCLSFAAQAQQSGIASTYGYNKGRGDSSTQRLACGGRLNVSAMTAAHRSLPCGTKVRVTNKRNGKSAIVTIRDRGPFVGNRLLDLSPAAASAIGMRYGLVPVTLERLR